MAEREEPEWDLRESMNLSPCRALSLSLNWSGRGPKRFFEAKDEPLRVSFEVSCAENFSRTEFRKATRLAMNAAVRNWEALSEVRAAILITSVRRSKAGDSHLPPAEFAANSSFDNCSKSTINVKSLSMIMKSYMTTLNKESMLLEGKDLIPMGLESTKAKESKLDLSKGLASSNSLSFGYLKEK